MWKNIDLKALSLLVFAGLLLFTVVRRNQNQQGGGGSQWLPFSYLTDQMYPTTRAAKSYSNVQNPLVYQDQWEDSCDKPNYVYFGSPNPLAHQMKPMKVPKDTMFYFANAKFSPECCQGGAPYSTSSGCVCAFPKQITPCKTEKPYEWPIDGPNSWQLQGK